MVFSSEFIGIFCPRRKESNLRPLKRRSLYPLSYGEQLFLSRTVDDMITELRLYRSADRSDL